MKYLIQFTFILLFSGCLVSEKPLIQPGKSTVDRKLAGVWQQVEKDNKNDSFLHVIVDPTGKEMKAVYVNHPLTPYGGLAEVNDLKIFPVKSGKNKYMSVEVLDTSRPDRLKAKKKAYMFFRYELDDEKNLKVWTPNYEKLEKAIKDKKLDGKASANTWDVNVRLTSEPKKILKWLDHADLKEDYDLVWTFKALVKKE
jgi:hypothetical protein